MNRYRKTIEAVLTEYSQLRYAYGDIQTQTVFDQSHDHYLLVNVGWDQGRVYGVLAHIDIIDGKLWIQRDDTEHGIATDLTAAGIPKEHIVLAFRPPEVRQHTGFAVA